MDFQALFEYIMSLNIVPWYNTVSEKAVIKFILIADMTPFTQTFNIAEP